VGIHKYIPTSETMWQHFTDYRDTVKEKPIKVKDWVGKDADQVMREKERPLTMEGFENYCFENNIIADLEDYFKNKDGRYSDFAAICSRIRKVIRQDQIEGGMAGIYSTSITQRLNGLTENSNVKTDGTLNVNYGRIPQRPASESGQDDTGTETV
jgi:cellulase/cellobiase CelA1